MTAAAVSVKWRDENNCWGTVLARVATKKVLREIQHGRQNKPTVKQTEHSKLSNRRNTHIHHRAQKSHTERSLLVRFPFVDVFFFYSASTMPAGETAISDVRSDVIAGAIKPLRLMYAWKASEA